MIVQRLGGQRQSFAAASGCATDLALASDSRSLNSRPTTYHAVARSRRSCGASFATIGSTRNTHCAAVSRSSDRNAPARSSHRRRIVADCFASGSSTAAASLAFPAAISARAYRSSTSVFAFSPLAASALA